MNSPHSVVRMHVCRGYVRKPKTNIKCMRMMEIVFSHLIGDLNVTRPNSVYSVDSAEGLIFFEVAATFSDSLVLVICCTLLLLSLYTFRLIVEDLWTGLFSGCVASRTVTACTWWCMISSQLLALKNYFYRKFYLSFIFTISCDNFFGNATSTTRKWVWNKPKLWNRIVAHREWWK